MEEVETVVAATDEAEMVVVGSVGECAVAVVMVEAATATAEAAKAAVVGAVAATAVERANRPRTRSRLVVGQRSASRSSSLPEKRRKKAHNESAANTRTRKTMIIAAADFCSKKLNTTGSTPAHPA
eukprot:737528-Pleurochrysis_carterae.AAC.4